jgi:hypothetical protein
LIARRASGLSLHRTGAVLSYSSWRGPHPDTPPTAGFFNVCVWLWGKRKPPVTRGTGGFGFHVRVGDQLIITDGSHRAIAGKAMIRASVTMSVMMNHRAPRKIVDSDTNPLSEELIT